MLRNDERKLPENALNLWPLPDGATARLINLSENATFLVEAPGGFQAVLRVHREGYNSEKEIASELAWMVALEADSGLSTPKVYAGHNGKAVQADPANPRRFMVLFHFIEGHHPKEDADLFSGFEELGEIAARTHLHSLKWKRPTSFVRKSWNLASVFGPQAIWGNWRDAPYVASGVVNTLEEAEKFVTSQLIFYGKSPDRFGLIHADMRLANLLIGPKGTQLIDFDDCGFGWHLYDFAAAVSFMEDDPRLPELKAVWLRGYNKHRSLNPADIVIIDTLVMLRRFALLAWIGSRPDSTEPLALAPRFAENTAKLGDRYLRLRSRRG